MSLTVYLGILFGKKLRNILYFKLDYILKETWNNTKGIAWNVFLEKPIYFLFKVETESNFTSSKLKTIGKSPEKERNVKVKHFFYFELCRYIDKFYGKGVVQNYRFMHFTRIQNASLILHTVIQDVMTYHFKIFH